MSEIKKIKIAIGVDHRGFELKQFLVNSKQIANFSIDWQDFGTFNNERTDYPIYAFKVIQNIKLGNSDLGVLACGTGIGMAIVANRYPGIYSGVVWDLCIARLAKEDDNINVLVLPADFIDFSQAFKMIEAWLAAEFKEERYAKRLKMIENLDI